MIKLRTKRANVVVTLKNGLIVHGRQLTAKEIDAIVNLHTPKKGQPDQKAIEFDIFDEVVKDWPNASGEDGKPLPCNKETKRQVFDYDPGLASDMLDTIRIHIFDKKDLEEKN